MRTKHYSSPNVFASSQKFRKSGLLLTKALLLACCLLFVITGCGSGTMGIPAASLRISPGNLDFGDVGLGQSVKRTIALSNAGVAALSISSANLSSTAFSLVGDQAFPITIPAGKTAPVSIGFTPVATQDYTAQLTFADSSSTPLGQVATRGRGQSSTQLTPQISANTSTVDFGDVDVDTTATQTISVTSTGTATATIDAAAVSGSGFVLTGGTLPATLKPGQSVTLNVQFNPTATGSASGQLDIHSNASSGDTRIALRGSGTSSSRPRLTLSANSLDFDSVTVNTATTQSLTLSSTGTSAVTINSANIYGGSFSLVGGVFPVTLNPGQSMTLRVQFKPAATGSASGKLAISSNASSSGPTVLALSGTATAAPSPQLTLSAGALSFGNVTVGTPTTQSLTLNSTGTAPVSISYASISGSGFSLLDGTFPVKLNPGQSMVVQVQFNPSTAGAAAGRIILRSNSSGSNAMTLALSGQGTAALTPQLKLSSGSLDFGDVTIDKPEIQSVTLNSTGTAPVTIASGTIAGAGFSLVGGGSFPATLAPGQSMTMQVRFSPSTSGTATGQIVLNSNSSGSNALTVALAGNGTVAPTALLSVSNNRLSFGSVTVGTSTTQTVTLNSTGTAPVTVNALDISGAGFVLTPGRLPAVLNPGQSMALQVQFQPSATGTARGQITIDSDSSSGDATITLRGIGTAALNPELTVSSSNLSFGNVTLSTSTTRFLILRSTGTAPVTVNSATIAGADFSLIGRSFPITLNPGQSVTLRIQFSPNTAGASVGQITINSNSSSGAETVSLSGNSSTAPVPQLTVSRTNLSFGSISVNTSSAQSLTLTSSGSAPLTVNTATVTGTGFSLTGGTLPATLNPGQSITLELQFAPVATGSSTGQLTINSNASPATVNVPLSGSSTDVPVPQLTVSNASLAFGDVTINTSSTQTLTLRSTGTSPVVINSTSLSGSGFAVTGGALPATLNPGQSMTLQVAFTPTAAGAATGQLTINSNSSSGASTIALTGSGTATPVSQLTVSTASLSFGNVTVKTSAAQSFTLSSTGTAPVTINSAIIAGTGFSLVGSPLPTILNPGQSVTLQVQFSPTAAGATTGQVTINSNSSSGAATVALSGSGIAAPVPQLTVSSAALSFGSIAVDSSTTQALTLRSTGTASVTVNSAAITGGMFSVVAQSFPISLAAGQSVTLQIQFNPTAAGTATGQLTISSNSTANNLTTVALSGTATSTNPQLTVSSSTLSFGSVALNTPTSKTLTLTSTGSSTVTVNAATVSGTGFTLVGGSFPLSLAPGQSTSLQLQFLPTSSGAQTGQIIIASNSTGGNLTVVLSGTGTGGASEVDLSWNAPTNSPVSVVGYNIYRSIGTAESFAVLNSSPVAAVTFADKNIASGTTYAYIVKSVDATGAESVASNQITVTIP